MITTINVVVNKKPPISIIHFKLKSSISQKFKGSHLICVIVTRKAVQGYTASYCTYTYSLYLIPHIIYYIYTVPAA